MIEVGDLAVAVLMERPNGGTAGRVEVRGGLRLALRLRLPLRVQPADVVIERAVLLHEDHDRVEW